MRKQEDQKQVSGNEKRLYIAYGSNLNLAQMQRRCPTADVIGKTYLKDYRLMFRGVATVEPQKGCMVPVVVFNLQIADEQNLDIYEGFPRLYRKENLWVNVNGRRVSAMIYIMNDICHPYSLPSTGYYGTIAEGYTNCGLDLKYLEQAFTETRRRMATGGVSYDRNY